MVSVAPLASSTMTTPISPTNHQPSSAVPAVNTPVKTKTKPNANTSKQKNKKPSKFSAGLKKLRQSRSVKPNIGFMVQLLNLENQLKMKGVKLIW